MALGLWRTQPHQIVLESGENASFEAFAVRTRLYMLEVIVWTTRVEMISLTDDFPLHLQSELSTSRQFLKYPTIFNAHSLC